MDLVKVPIVPQWNLTSGCVCTPDGALLYLGPRSINYISKKLGNSLPQLKSFYTRQAILSIDIDPGWPLKNEIGDKLFAVLAQDSSVQIWNFEKEQAVCGHKAHYGIDQQMCGNGPGTHPGDRAQLSYMCNRNVLSIDLRDIVIYCVASNTYCRIKTFGVPKNHQITTLRCSPFNENIFSVGTNRGLVIIYDLLKQRIIFTLRGHDSSITSLSWNRINTKLVDQKVNATNLVDKNLNATKNDYKSTEAEEIFDIYDYDYLENEFGAPFKSSKKIYANDIEYAGVEKSDQFLGSKKFDFAEACQSLKEEIVALSHDSHQKQGDEVTLVDCVKFQQHTSSCDDYDDGSTVESLELVNHSSSDGSFDIDGAVWRPTQQILHAEVHSSQVTNYPPSPEKLNKTKASENVDNEEKLSVPKNEIGSIKNHIYSNEEDLLLVSASIDGNIFVWNAKTGACCENLRSRDGSIGKNNNIQIAWIDEFSFITNNNKGDLMFWKLKPQEMKEIQGRRYKYKKEKCTFQQNSVVSFSVCKLNKTLWCISSFREISCHSLDTSILHAKYGCSSLNISAIKECPDNMNKIALGFSDNRIGIIDVSQLSPMNISIENFTLRIDAPVLSLVWSPNSKSLAFGTLDGRIGVVNTEQPKKQPFFFNAIGGKPIYSIDWQNNDIFIVCNGVVAVFDGDMLKKDGDVLLGIEKASAISVCKDFLFVGTQQGYLQIFMRNSVAGLHNYKLVYDLQVAQRYITEIAWSAIEINQFAVVANSNCFHIFNFDFDQKVANQIRKFEINNKKTAIASVKWSNCSKHLFLTCGFDGGIRIWDLRNEGNSEKYLKNYHCPMSCGIFLPKDENIVLCAGKSTSLEFFDMRVEKSNNAISKRVKGNTLGNVQWAQKVQIPQAYNKIKLSLEKKQFKNGHAIDPHLKDCEAITEKYQSSERKQPSSDVLKSLSGLKIHDRKDEDIERFKENIPTNIPDETQDMQRVFYNEKSQIPVFMKNFSTLLYLTSKELNKDVAEKIELMLCNKGNNATQNLSLCSRLFGSREEAKQLLLEELNNHRHSETKGISTLIMPQLNESLKDEILKRIQKKELCEWHISLAPSISYGFWKNCCNAYSEQLLDQGYILQAATFKLAIHNQCEAIEMLCNKKYFKESLLLARLYLEENDPLITEISGKWIDHLILVGNMTGASYLHLLQGNKKLAYEILCKIRNPTPEIFRLLQILKAED